MSQNNSFFQAQFNPMEQYLKMFQGNQSIPLNTQQNMGQFTNQMDFGVPTATPAPNSMGMFGANAGQNTGQYFNPTPAVTGNAGMDSWMQSNPDPLGTQNLAWNNPTAAAPAQTGTTWGDMFGLAGGALQGYLGYQGMQTAQQNADTQRGHLQLSQDQWDEKLRKSQVITEQNKSA